MLLAYQNMSRSRYTILLVYQDRSRFTILLVYYRIGVGMPYS